MTEPTDEGIARLPGEGETTSLFGDTFVVKAAGEETGGTLAVIEAALGPHSAGTPLHVNTLEDENYYVIEGMLTFWLGERTLEAPAGAFVHIPKGVVHTALERHRRACPIVGLPRSGRSREFFADLAELMVDLPPGPPDMSRMAAVYRSTVCKWWGRLRAANADRRCGPTPVRASGRPGETGAPE